MKRFNKILIANRGEIAARIMHTAKKMGIETVAIYTEEEGRQGFAGVADEAWSLGNGGLEETYLNIPKIIKIALDSGAQAVHPGYGFLSENADFARACQTNNLVFVGPGVKVLEQMGNKVTAKEIARKAGVNILESRLLEMNSLDRLASELRYPALIKASFGGGGKGMVLVENSEDLRAKAEKAKRTAESYFGRGEIFVEEYIRKARHVEVQILGDSHGNVIHLYERDCTLQRNHQKIIEEAPAAFLNKDLRQEILDAAVAICKKIDYQNAGTVEFLVDDKGAFYFLEMNPRIQVEHPVSEFITGIDIVKEQLRIAAGNPISFKQNEVRCEGHAIESRIYAEDPANQFMPSGKALEYIAWPEKLARIETDLSESSGQGSQFDPLLGKVITHGVDREHALQKMDQALSKTRIAGPESNVLFLKELLLTEQVKNQDISTSFCADELESILARMNENRKAVKLPFLLAAGVISYFFAGERGKGFLKDRLGYWRIFNACHLELDDKRYMVEFEKDENELLLKIDNSAYKASVKSYSANELSLRIGDVECELFVRRASLSKVNVLMDARSFDIYCDHFPEATVLLKNNGEENRAGENLINSHLFGKIVNINVASNQTVDKGDVLMIVESMKSENAILSPRKAKIKTIEVEVGTQVTDEMPLVYLEDI